LSTIENSKKQIEKIVWVRTKGNTIYTTRVYQEERERDVLGSALLWKEARDKVGDE